MPSLPNLRLTLAPNDACSREPTPSGAQPKRDRSQRGTQYTLVVSIKKDAADMDIWTPVATELGIPVETAAPV